MKRAKCEICGSRVAGGGNVCEECDRESGGPEQREFMRKCEENRANGVVEKDDPFRPGNRLAGWFRRPS